MRYLAHPLKIRNAERKAGSKTRFKAERRIYEASKLLKIASIV